MTCGSRRRRASDLALLALVLLPVLAAAAVPVGVVVEAPDVPRAEWTRLEQWRRADARWLGGLTPAQAGLRAALADSAPDVLRELVAGATPPVADGDSLPPARPVEHLLRDRWQRRGHLGARVSSRGDSLVVRPGPVWRFGPWTVTGEEFPGRERLLATWLPPGGAPFRQADLDEAIARVLAGMGNAGFPFARWLTRETRADPATTTVAVEALLLPGQKAVIGPVTSDLPRPRAARFLARASGLRSGEPFRNSELARARDRLLARDLYAVVGEPQVYLTTSVDTVGVHFPVIPRRKVNRLQVVLGLSRRDEGGSRLSGEVDLRLPDMGGSGRDLQVGWRDDGQDRRRFGFRYLEPLAFGTGLDMGLAVDNEVEQAVYTRFRVDNTWGLPVVALWGVELGLGWDRSTFPAGVLERTSRVRASGAVTHRRGDRARSGWEGRFAIETGWRSATSRTDGTGGAQLGEETTQRIFSVDTAGEAWLSRTLSLAGRTAFRQLTGGEPDVPVAERFRFGGAASLRGYREQEFNGRRAAWGGLELRLGRAGGSRVYTFYDLGYFEFWTDDPESADPADLVRRRGWPRGYGLGLLARTPGGDISLAVGFPGTVDFERAKLHVTLLESF